MTSPRTPCAEIEPGHVNASKYLRVTEQHMTQLGLPIAGSLQPLHDDNRWAGVGQAAERPMVMQPAAATIDLTTSGMSFLRFRHVYTPFQFLQCFMHVVCADGEVHDIQMQASRCMSTLSICFLSSAPAWFVPVNKHHASGLGLCFCIICLDA